MGEDYASSKAGTVAPVASLHAGGNEGTSAEGALLAARIAADMNTKAASVDNHSIAGRMGSVSAALHSAVSTAGTEKTGTKFSLASAQRSSRIDTSASPSLNGTVSSSGVAGGIHGEGGPVAEGDGEAKGEGDGGSGGGSITRSQTGNPVARHSLTGGSDSTKIGAPDQGLERGATVIASGGSSGGLFSASGSGSI